MMAVLLAALESDADRQKFIEIYEQYHVQMERTAICILKEQSDVEDAVQNAFMQIIRHFEKIFEIPCEELPFWIISIVKNEARIILRKNQRTVPLEDWDRLTKSIDDISGYTELVDLFTRLPQTYRAVSPTVRAAVVRWVTEWFDTHITYRYSGETLIGEMPQYEITDLPKGYVEDENQRIEGPNYVGIVYCSETDADADPIYFDYMYMQQGSASDYAVEDTTILQVTVNGMEGYLYLTTIPEQSDSTITWIDSANNIQFSVDAALDEVGILHIAESVSLVNWR